MRSQIEKKIGCSIEEYLEKAKNRSREYEAEYPNPFAIFTVEERKFIQTIIDKM